MTVSPPPLALIVILWMPVPLPLATDPPVLLVIVTLTSPAPSSVTVIVSPASVSRTVSEWPCVVIVAGGGVVLTCGLTAIKAEALRQRRVSSVSNRA